MRNRVAGRLMAVWLVAIAAAPAAAQSLLWGRQFGTSAGDWGTKLAPDGVGGAFAAGWTYGDLFALNAGENDLFLARYDNTGHRTWGRQVGTAFVDQVWSIASDGAGGCFVSGDTTGNLFAANPTVGQYLDAILARYDGAGTLMWGVQVGTAAHDRAYAVAPDTAGGAFVAGPTSGGLFGSSGGFLARLDGAGTLRWGLQFGSTSNDHPTALAPDGSGGAFVAGRTWGSLYAQYSGGGYGDGFLARFDSLGFPVWGVQIAPSSGPGPSSLVLVSDGTGGVFAAGSTHGDLFGSHAGGEYDAWVARYDGQGVRRWGRQFGTSFWDFARALAPDGSGGVFVGGRTQGDLFPPTSGGAFVAHYDGAGNPRGGRQVGVFSYDDAFGLAPDGGGGMFLGGMTFGSLFSPYIGGTGFGDAFIAHLTGGCYSDCNGDGALTVADFGCFQTKFVAADPYADCNADGSFTVADFGCFQTKFVQGCP